MKKFFSILVVILFGSLMMEFGFALGGLASIGVILFCSLIYTRLEKINLMNQYSQDYENVPIIGNDPDTGEEVDLPSDLVGIAICVPYDEVMQAIEKEKRLLIESGNKYLSDPELAEEYQLQVFGIIKDDGEHVGESWKKYCKRAIKEARANRSQRHRILKEIDPVYYNKVSNLQKGVIWEKLT